MPRKIKKEKAQGLDPAAIPARPFMPVFKKAKKIGVNLISKKLRELPAEYPEEDDDIFARPNYIEFSGFRVPRNWHKKIAVFILVAVALILSLQAFMYYKNLRDAQGRVLVATIEAIQNLKSGRNSAARLDLDDADSQFDQAKDNFILAQREIDALSGLTNEILKLLPEQNRKMASGVALLEAGEIIAETGQILINSGQNFLQGKNLVDYHQSLVNFKANLETVIEKFNQAKAKLQEVNPGDLPAEHQQTFAKILTYLPNIEAGLTDIYTINNVLLKVLGNEQWQRYLVFFLNNNELRGGGGFMGTYALLDVDRGEIKNMEIPGGGTYDLRAALVPKVISPEPLHLISPHWEFQDANWWPDFPTNAKKIQWFYLNANGPSVDGVIAITATLMERLLEIFGPIPMPEYGRDITSENFTAETQKIVQLEYDKEENRPKQFLADLAPKLLQKIFTVKGADFQKLFDVLKQGLNERHFLVYFNDPQTENIVTDFGWSGGLKETAGDYLSVVHTNLAGGKTDKVIKETIKHQADIQPDGSIVNTITLVRNHTGVAGEDIFTGVQNNSYVRFYVPLGSVLLEASGFKKPPAELFEEPDSDYRPDLDLISNETEHIKDEDTGTDIYKESGKTVFGNWLQLKPGEIQETTIKYRLPFKVAKEGEDTFYYSLLAQKQAGSLGSELKSYLKLNETLKPLTKFPPDLASDNTGVSFNSTLITDKFYGVVLQSL